MKEATIKYKDSKTLELLKSLAQYLDFSISFSKKEKPAKKDPKPKNSYDTINGVPLIPGDSSIDIKALDTIFTGKDLDARKLRTEGWQR